MQSDGKAISNKDELFTLLRQHEKDISAFGVKKMGIFGSFVKNDVKENSDVDILLEVELEKKTFKNFFDLKKYLEALLHREVDLVTAQSLNKFIGHHILKDVEYVFGAY